MGLCVCSSKQGGTVDLDNEGGQTFLRVLIHLIMQDYPPLVSGSLQLIFKHFSQRAEVLQAFKQVWRPACMHQSCNKAWIKTGTNNTRYVCNNQCRRIQVQLLVSEQDVENYKQIKANLDQLRLTVEKSELWVEKSGSYGNEDITENQNKEQNLEVCPYWQQEDIAGMLLDRVQHASLS